MAKLPLTSDLEALPKVREAEVFNAAARVFHERGYASSSVQTIADELGILKGSLYYYIKSKEDLLYGLLKDVHDDLSVILDEAKTNVASPPLERLFKYVRSQVEYATRNIPKISIYYRDADQLSDEHRLHIHSRRKEHQRFVLDLISEGQSDGSILANEDPYVLSNLIFGSFIWTYRWFEPSDSLAPDEVATAAARFAVRALTQE